MTDLPSELPPGCLVVYGPVGLPAQRNAILDALGGFDVVVFFDDDFFPQSQRAKEKGWTLLQLTADHNAQWSAPEALVEMLASIR